MQKYRLVHEGVQNLCAGITLHEAPTTTDGVLALAHHPDYIAAVSSGTLTLSAQKEIGFPWSLKMVERSRRSVGATIAACRTALTSSDQIAVNLAGGTHHAYADHGGGFCVFNDAVIAARLMQAERHVQRVAIVDLDVHQGNGTASILARDESIFTLSLHGAGNYPFSKESSDLDVGLRDGTQDAEYLNVLQDALDQLFSRFAPQLIIYLAGADPHEGDRLGRLKLSMEGLAQRDQMVFSAAAQRVIPVAVTMAGGYGKNIQDTVAVHLQTIALAARHASRQITYFAAGSGDSAPSTTG
ncbi:histone deacetylase [Glaciimonas immobilis]|nr:histone deacetylase [Glaciimonas immobilis]